MRAQWGNPSINIISGWPHSKFDLGKYPVSHNVPIQVTCRSCAASEKPPARPIYPWHMRCGTSTFKYHTSTDYRVLCTITQFPPFMVIGCCADTCFFNYIRFGLWVWYFLSSVCLIQTSTHSIGNLIRSAASSSLYSSAGSVHDGL